MSPLLHTVVDIMKLRQGESEQEQARADAEKQVRSVSRNNREVEGAACIFIFKCAQIGLRGVSSLSMPTWTRVHSNLRECLRRHYCVIERFPAYNSDLCIFDHSLRKSDAE